MIYNVRIICLAIAVFTKTLFAPTGIGRLLLACHFISIGLLVFDAGSSASATYMLHFLAYLSNKLQQISEEESKPLFRWYIVYILSSALFFTLSYDVGVHKGHT